MLIAFVIMAAGVEKDAAYRGAGALLYVLLLIGAWLYGAFMQASRYQATLGQLAMGLRVVGDASGRISFGRATGRHWATLLSGAILGIGYLLCPFTARKQALHDIVSGCFVIYVRG